MKRQILLFTLLLPICGFSQIFSLTELVALSQNNLDYFDTKVTTKGYAFYTNRDDEFSKGSCYSYGQRDYTKMAAFFITYFSYSDPERTLISWQTTNKNNYLKVKNDLRSLGFKLVTSLSDSSCAHLTYKKGHLSLDLYSCQTPDDRGVSNATYEINITNSKD